MRTNPGRLYFRSRFFYLIKFREISRWQPLCIDCSFDWSNQYKCQSYEKQRQPSIYQSYWWNYYYNFKRTIMCVSSVTRQHFISAYISAVWTGVGDDWETVYSEYIRQRFHRLFLHQFRLAWSLRIELMRLMKKLMSGYRCAWAVRSDWNISVCLCCLYLTAQVSERTVPTLTDASWRGIGLWQSVQLHGRFQGEGSWI